MRSGHCLGKQTRNVCSGNQRIAGKMGGSTCRVRCAKGAVPLRYCKTNRKVGGENSRSLSCFRFPFVRSLAPPRREGSNARKIRGIDLGHAAFNLTSVYVGSICAAGWGAALGFSILEQRDLLKRAMIASNFNGWAQIFRTLFLLSDCDFPCEVERDQLTNKKRSFGLGNERGKSTVKLRVPVLPVCLPACVK